MTRPTAALKIARSENCPCTESSLKSNSTSVAPASEVVHVFVELVKNPGQTSMFPEASSIWTMHLRPFLGPRLEEVNRNLFWYKTSALNCAPYAV